MNETSNTAQERLRERAFTLWEEAGKDVHDAYQLWHKLRSLNPSAPALAGRPQPAGKAALPAKQPSL